jgi:hypothetical protein
MNLENSGKKRRNTKGTSASSPRPSVKATQSTVAKLRATNDNVDLNSVALIGEVTSVPYPFGSEAGEEGVSFDLRTRVGGAAAVVEVRARNDAKAVASIVLGTRVGVVGSVARRFFVAGGRTQSRTEVRAEEIVVVNTPSRRRRVHDLARHLLDEDGAGRRPIRQ